tara:strand:- start:1543 stop:2028 length:486 start_codon:yes stop_codon:yes gene_type:complete
MAPPTLHEHAAMLRRYLHVLGAGADRVDDLLQEVFVVALHKLVDDRGAAAAASFLRGVAKNLLLRQRRSWAARREIVFGDEVWREQCNDGSGDRRVDALRSCIDGLPERSRELLRRCYADDAGRHELGDEFGLAVDGVKTALRRLRAALRECIERRIRGGS